MKKVGGYQKKLQKSYHNKSFRNEQSAFKFKSRWQKEARKAEKDKPTLGERVEQQKKVVLLKLKIAPTRKMKTI